MKSLIRARRRAFTLIELLTVIAIIAVLAAIIFPVFGAVRENARRADCMSNMKTIASSLKQYELDNRKYPDFLFAPAIASNGSGGCLAVTSTGTVVPSSTPGSKLVAATGTGAACTQEEASATGKLGGDFVDSKGTVVASGGLYPEYIKSRDTFLCKNNTWFYPNSDPAYSEAPGTDGYPVTAPKTVYAANSLDKNQPGTFSDTQTIRYYKFDSYDVNPLIQKDGSGAAVAKINPALWSVRYQRQWLDVVNDPSTNPSLASDKARQLYQDQLIWKNPSDDAPVTMCSHHAPKGKVIVLYLSGTAKVIDIATLKNKENAATTAGLPPTAADFDTYKMTP